MNRVAALLITLALIVGMVGCPAAPVQVELDVSSTPGGSVASPGEGTYNYGAGTVVDLVAEAEQGYRFVNWTGDVDTVANVNTASTTIRVEGDYTITANFIAEYNLTISSAGGGQVTAPGEGTFTYDAGTVVTLLAAADECYEFDGWAGDAVTDPDSSATTITMGVAKSVTARFAIMRYELTTHSTDGGSVVTPGEGSFEYDCATTVALVAEAEDGYVFARWTGNVDAIDDINAASTMITMNHNYSVTADFVAEGAVYIADRNLEAVLRAAIGGHVGPIYPLDLEGLASLHAGGRSISDITGMEHCASLIELHLQDNQISDISPLQRLTNLTYLDLWGNRVHDVSPLANLSKLTGLDLGGNRISDMSSVSTLTGLTWLSLWGNQIADISPLANLTDLTGLNLGRNEIVNISPLAALTSLTWLSLDHNETRDISPLTNLTELVNLDLWMNQIVNISPLANLTNLTGLNLGCNRIVSISSLSDLGNLTNLQLSGNQINSVSPLANLTDLVWLYLGGNQVGDISPLANLTKLTMLDLGDNRLSDISSLADMTGLTQLWLDTNQISDISPLASLANLTYLRLWGNQISYVSPLASLANLTELDLGINRISDISPLADLPGLTQLYLHENHISDVSPLADLTNLTWLSLWDNQIGDLAPLAYLTKLTVLELGGNQISDIIPLVENEGLSQGDYVDLRWNPLSSDSTNMLIPQLQARGVKFNPEFPVVETCPCLLDAEWIRNPTTGNYYALTSHMSWMAGEACAQAFGGHLVTLNSWEEELWVKNTFGWHEGIWIGFSVIGREHRAGHFVWSSGEPVIYTNWNPGEPNNYRGEDCAVMNAGDGWNDLSRHGHHRAVIEVSEKPG